MGKEEKEGEAERTNAPTQTTNAQATVVDRSREQDSASKAATRPPKSAR